MRWVLLLSDLIKLVPVFQTFDAPIAAALEFGFNSHSHLGRRFRQLTGITPKAYRTQ